MDLLKVLVFTENILGIYRNYEFFSFHQKCLIVLRIAIEFTICFFISVLNIYMVYILDFGGESVFEYFREVFTFAKSLVLLFDGVRHSKAYKLYYESIKTIRSHCLNEPQYAKSRKSLIIRCGTSVTAFILPFIAFIITGLHDNNSYDAGEIFFWPLVYKLTFYAWIDLRYIFEHLVAYCIVIEIYDFMKILNSSVCEVIEQYSVAADSFICVNDVEEEDSSETSEKENNWRDSYENILKCSKHVSQCFGELFVYSALVVVFHSVWAIYRICTVFLKKNEEFFIIRHIDHTLLFHILGNFALLRAGQKILNETFTLNNSLARLFNIIQLDASQSKIRSVKDLYRLVITSPVEIKFGKLYLGMYLLPMILSLTATYIVTVLQFNHVV